MLLLQFTIILFLCVFPKDSMYNFLLLLFSVRFKKFHCTHPNVQGWSVTSAKFAKTHVYILYKYIHGLLISCLHKVLTSAPSNTFEINWNWAGPYRLKSLLNLTKLLWLKGSESLHPCSKIFLPSQKTRNLINGNGIRIISSIMTFVYNVQVTICCTVFYLKLDYNILCSLSIELNDSHSSAFAWLYYQSSVLLAPRSTKLCDLQQRFGERVVGSTKPVHNHTGELTVQPQSSIGDCFAVLKLSEVKCLTHR